MIRLIRSHAPVVLLIALLMLLALTTPVEAQLPVGADAPSFVLYDTEGVQHGLASYGDQVVVLFFIGYD